MQEIEINEAASIIVYESAIFEFEKKSTPKPVKEPDELKATSDKIALWGNGNDFPNLIREELKNNQDLGSLLDLQARILYAGGVDYELMDPQTYEPLKKAVDPEIELFLRRNWHYPMQATQDFYKYFNFFPQFSIGESRRKINWLISRPANYCRYELQDSTGLVNNCYISSNWPYAKTDDKSTLKIPTINPLFDLAEEVREKKDSQFIYGLSYPTGELYYSIPNWWALKNSKWLELANKIPAFKLALMKNQVSVKYHIQFPEHYWEWKFPKWKDFTAAQKTEKYQEEIKKITEFLKGEENAGKSLVSMYKFDAIKGIEYPGIKIEPIDDKIKDGIYLEDSVEATIKIFTALGLDPSILGIVPGKGGSNRAGSDKREALNIYISIIQPHADLVLRPYDFISDYNGWNNDKQIVRWHFKAPILQTLDKLTPSKRETIPADAKPE